MENNQSEFNLDLIALQSYIEDYKEGVKASKIIAEEFANKKLKQLEMQLLKVLPEDFTNLFSISLTDTHRDLYVLFVSSGERASTTHMNQVWQQIRADDQHEIKVNLTATSNAISTFKLNLTAIFKGNDVEIKDTSTVTTDLTTMTASRKTWFDTAKGINEMQAYVVREYDKQRPVLFTQ